MGKDKGEKVKSHSFASKEKAYRKYVADIGDLNYAEWSKQYWDIPFQDMPSGEFEKRFLSGDISAGAVPGQTTPQSASQPEPTQGAGQQTSSTQTEFNTYEEAKKWIMDNWDRLPQPDTTLAKAKAHFKVK
jgi:hypothetical protein